MEKSLKELKKKDSKLYSIVLKTYSNALNDLVKKAKTCTVDDSELSQLDSIKRKLRLAFKKTKILKTYVRIWELRKYILQKDATYFTSCKTEIDEDDDIAMDTLMDVISDGFGGKSTEEQDEYWAIAATMLNCIATVKKY